MYNRGGGRERALPTLMNKAKVISWCGSIPLVGASLRRIARRYPEGSVVTVASGHLAGCKWQRSHRYVSGYWLGIYERPIQECLVRELRPGDIFYDIGANAGFFTLLGAKCVGPRGQVFSFEPLPENIRSVRTQLELNEAAHCTVVEAAVSDRDGTMQLCEGRDTSTARLAAARETAAGLPVRTVTLDHFIDAAPPPNFVKMDIEGSELAALHGAARLLGGQAPPTMLIEFHSERLRNDGCSFLSGFGYQFFSVSGRPVEMASAERHVLCVPATRTD